VEHVFVRFKRYFHPSETRVNRVVTRVWCQDVFRFLRCLQRSWNHYVFLLYNIQNLQIHNMCKEKGIPITGDSNHMSVVLNEREPGSWRSRVQKVDLSKFCVFLFFLV
jgi:hypothetical protein